MQLILPKKSMNRKQEKNILSNGFFVFVINYVTKELMINYSKIQYNRTVHHALSRFLRKC